MITNEEVDKQVMSPGAQSNPEYIHEKTEAANRLGLDSQTASGGGSEQAGGSNAKPQVAELPPLSIDLKPYCETISVPDLDKSEKWYQSKLDFHVVKSKDYPGVRIADLENGSSRIELVELKNS